MTITKPMPGMTVREARNQFLARHGLDESTYTAPGFVLHIGPWNLSVPNPGMLPLHDLHHVATGYGSGLPGEAEVSAFELRAGPPTLLIRLLCLGAVLIGIVICPCRVWRAWVSACGARLLYRCGRDSQDLLDMTVEELRGYLGIPPEGLAAPARTRQEDINNAKTAGE